MSTEKMSVTDVRNRIVNEGLGYAIQYYMSGDSIADPVLAKMWDKTAELLNKIEKYTNDKSFEEQAEGLG